MGAAVSDAASDIHPQPLHGTVAVDGVESRQGGVGAVLPRPQHPRPPAVDGHEQGSRCVLKSLPRNRDSSQERFHRGMMRWKMPWSETG